MGRFKDWLRGNVPLGIRRSPKWRAVERNLILQVKQCECCGAKKRLEVHHIIPFHLRREWELRQDNLIVLCRRCHFFIGHLDNWKSYNPFVNDSAFYLRQKITKARNGSHFG